MQHLSPYYYAAEQLKAAAASGSGISPALHSASMAASSVGSSLFSIDSILAPRPLGLSQRPGPYFPYPATIPHPSMHDFFGKLFPF